MEELIRIVEIIMRSGEIIVCLADDLEYDSIKINNNESYNINTVKLHPHANGTEISEDVAIIINSNFIESKRSIDFVPKPKWKS